MASAPINKVQDKNGDQFFPITHQQAVINDNGDDLVTELGKKYDKTGGSISGSVAISGAASMQTAEVGTSSISQLSFKRGNWNYIWATVAGGTLAFGVQDKGSPSAMYTSMIANQYGLGVGAGTTANSTNALYVNGNIGASGTITPGSDSRIKDQQEAIDVEDAMLIISRLIPRTWVWNDKAQSAGKKAAGLIAQEVKEVIPEAVEVSEAPGFDDFHMLNYNTIQGYELAAIQGLIKEVKALRAELEELKKTR